MTKIVVIYVVLELLLYFYNFSYGIERVLIKYYDTLPREARVKEIEDEVMCFLTTSYGRVISNKINGFQQFSFHCLPQ